MIGRVFWVCVVFSLIGLAGCSGGSGSSTPSPVSGPAANRSPSLTSANSVAVAENTSGTVYTATATDPENDSVTFGIGGVDASAFTIDAQSGDIAFVSPPDFESPDDSDASNDYVIVITATDTSNNSTSLTVTISVTDLNEGVRRYLDQVFSTVDVQRDIEFAPGLFLDVYTPAGDAETDRPVIIVASGGGFLEQDRESVESIAVAFSERGYVAATMDYRVLDADPLTADEFAIAIIQAAHDMFAAVRFFRADALGSNVYGVRTDAIFTGGESAGAVMAAISVTLDPADVIASDAVRDFLISNGGAYGNVGSNGSVSSLVQGALSLSGALLELSTVDSQSGVIYAAHEEFDPIVACETAQESSSFTGLVFSGPCDFVPAFVSAGISAELYLVNGAVGHVDFSDQQREEIFEGVLNLFFDAVISP